MNESLCFIIFHYQVFGIVNSADSFKEQHLVMNGCSDVLMEGTCSWKVLYGERYFVCDFWYYHSFIYLSCRRCRGAHSKTEFLLYISVCVMEVFGKPTGYHARSAIGVNTLPLDVSVEIEAIVQVKPLD